MIRLSSNFLTPKPGKKIIAIHIIPNISKSEVNQKMKFGQLKEYHMRSIYLENFYRKCGRETIAGPFLKDQN